MEKEIVIKKNQVEKYTIRQPGNWYALITVDDQFGDISVQSDWGNWSYIWSTPGRGKESLKQFLLSCDDGYITNKFSYGQGGGRSYFYAHESKEKMLRQILEWRRKGRNDSYDPVDKDMAREAWETVKSAAADCGDSSQMFVMRISDCPGIKALWGEEVWYDPPIVTGYEPGLVRFMEKCWPLFRAELKREIYGQACNDTAAQSPG